MMTINSNNEQQQQSIGAGAGIIKTTARFQEAQEPLRQKPIIQIDPDAPLQQYENLARSSIDSGRDNPFRPDGKIYKSADPIVDYYKYGPHQSRTQSPTDSKLLMGDHTEDSQDENSLGAGDEKTKSKNKNKKKKTKRKVAVERANKLPDEKRKPCWRRWFCCCCCFETEDGKCRRCCDSDEDDKKEKFDTSQYDSPPSVDAKTKDFKQSKIVVLPSGAAGDSASDQSVLHNGQNGSHERMASSPSHPAAATDDIKTTTTETIPILATDQKVGAKSNSLVKNLTEGTEQTEPKKRTQRCVIS